MRFFLSLIVSFFATLVFLERVVRRSIQMLRKYGKKAISLFKKVRKTRAKRKKKQQPFTLPFRSKIKYFLLGSVFSLFFVFLPLAFLIFIQDLPSPYQLTHRQLSQTTKIYDRHGTLLTEIYAAQNRKVIPLSEIPKSLQAATIAIEDKNFYSHPGFDIPAIVRALKSVIEQKSLQGGSTITQQLIKSSLLTPERSFSRKAKELVLAFWTERVYTKKQILEMYFNQVPYGGTAWGVEAAAETYFGKPVSKLSLAESAFLAGLTAAPTYYSPYGLYPEAWKGRQQEVLQRMVALNYISEKEAHDALREKLTFQRQHIPQNAPHFVSYVKDFLITKYGLAAVEKGGLSITTTIDLKQQELAEKAVHDEVAKARDLNLTNGAALITNPQQGDVLAMVGSHDFNDPEGGNVNLTTAKRQPGSSIKVVTYAAALTKGYTAASMIDDTPVSFPSASGAYAPVNYDGRFHGRVSLRQALATSYNIPAVKLLDAIGIPTMVTLGKEMGITTWGEPKNYGLSLTLGSGEVTMVDLATVYGTFANKGNRVDLNPLLQVTDAQGNVLEEKTTPEKNEVLDPGVAFIMSDILADNTARASAFGTNSPLVIPGHTVSVKTGTTDNKRDNWTAGYTDKYVTIVWVGNNNNSPMSPKLTSGITGAAPIWNTIMTKLLEKEPDTKPQQPESVIKKNCFGRTEYFLLTNEQNCGYSRQPSQ